MELKNIKSDILNKIDSTVALNKINILWRPHNYRYRIPINPIKITPQKVLFYRVKYTKRTSKYTLKSGRGFTIEINPSSIIIIYSSKKWYSIKGTIQEFNIKVDSIVKDIEDKCISKANEISMLWKLKHNLNKKKLVSSENSVIGEKFLDKIDQSLIIHHPVFTKLNNYPFHFKSPEYLKNFINNRAVESIVPEICIRLDKFTEVIKKDIEARELEIYNKKLHQKVLESMDRSLKKFSYALEHLNSNILKVKYEGRRLSGLERVLIKNQGG